MNRLSTRLCLLWRSGHGANFHGLRNSLQFNHSHDAAKPRGKTPSPADCKTPGATSSTTTHTAVTKYATGHLYTLNLRSHAMSHLPASVPPGVVALLYKVRWDVEKAFDEFKYKLVETKAWTSSANAKTVQARMLFLTHNLMTLMEQTIGRHRKRHL
jgi:IS4 transposase